MDQGMMSGSMETNMNNDFDLEAFNGGEMEMCIQNCLKCYSTCQEAFFHCLQQQSGPCYDVNHLQLLQTCAEVCRTSAQLMMLQSPFHHYMCKLTSEVCKACAESCELIEDSILDACARICHHCADSCE